MNYKDFFKLLDNNNPICLKDNKIRINVSDIPQYNGKNDLYFIPNIGGLKSRDITDFKAFFIDLDCGRNKNGNYFSTEDVKKYKDIQLQIIKDFSIKPNAIVETRNGFHIYWFIKEKIEFKLWQKIENFLVNYFDADKKVINANNQMRIPCTYWMKYKSSPFFCNIIELNDNNTYIETYCKMLKSENKIRSDGSKILYAKSKPKTEKNNIKTFNSYKEVFDYITKSVSMFDYLKKYYSLQNDTEKSFCCIFHDDKNPSANIFKTDSGIELYYCHSSGCGFVGNLIQVVAQLEKCSRSTAIDKICRNLNLQYTENTQIIRFLLDNIKSIDDDIQYSHKDLYGVIYRYLPTLKALHYIALKNILYSNDEKDLIFSASTAYVAKELGRSDKKNTGADISLLCLLKLIDKIDLDSNAVSEEYKQYIRRFQGERNKYINVYSLPTYTYDVLTECNNIAKLVKEKNLRKKHFTYESVANAFDKATADRVFPQIKNKPIKNIDEFLMNTISVLIEEYGYFTQDSVRQYYTQKKHFFKENQYIKQLPAIIQALNLHRVKASKQIKEKYNILLKGYPFLFVKQGD